MIASIHPSIAVGTMEAPPSKSMAHRLLLCAGLSEGESLISNVDLSQDILATLDCLKALGAEIEVDSIPYQAVKNNGGAGSEAPDGPKTIRIRGIDIKRCRQSAILPCRECGSTLRFFVPLCLMSGQEMKLTGSRTLMSRPMTVYEKICRDQGLYYQFDQSALTVAGQLKSGEYEVAGNISSQFISGLLFVLPLLEEDSRICLIPPVESRPYIMMTMQALSAFGIRTEWEDDATILIPGNQRYMAQNVQVEGDYSNAAFFEAFNLIGGQVALTGLKQDSLQGDRVYRECFRQLQEGRARIDLSDCPDLGPILIAVAALKDGAHFTGTKRLKIKESDRGQAMKEELAKLGICLDIREDEIIVPARDRQAEEDLLHKNMEETQKDNRRDKASGLLLDGHNDHRIVMALTVFLSRTGGKIRGAEAVRKSLPDFFKRINELGIKVDII